jgi:hypothetical protein
MVLTLIRKKVTPVGETHNEARNAFNSLKDVPGISPRVLRVWTLYAETQLSVPTSQSAAEYGECSKVGAS